MLSHYSTSLSRDDLKNYFLAGCKSKNDLAVGVEWEKIGVYRDTGHAIRYSGPRGVRAIFESLVKDRGWTPVSSSKGDPIALKKGPMSITLEPGGQIELSGQKAQRIEDNAQELFCHLKELKELSDPLGIAWLGLGAQPFDTAQEIEWVPKDRYDVMRDKLAGHGALTYSMMKETASVQISVDYETEQDAVEKLRLGLALSPVLTALFANSPLEKGAPSSYLSRRAHIWRHTSPERAGVPWKVLDPSFTLDDYVDYALDVPLLFLQRGGRWLGIGDISFREYLEKGWKDLVPELADWDLHLTSIFTEARLKKYVEIRSIDCQSTPMGLAAVAFVKGLFYGGPHRKAAWELLAGWTPEERQRLMEEAPKTALETKVGGGLLGETALALVGLAEKGLPADEKKYLEPLKGPLEARRCPAQKLLSCLQGSPSQKEAVDSVIRCCEILSP